MELKKIIVAVDFSPESEDAVAQSLNIARHTGAELVLLHAAPVPKPLPEGAEGADSISHSQQLLRQLLTETRGQLDDLRQKVLGQGVEVSHMVVDELPATGIADAAEELDADLVVVGTHGRTGIRRFLLGSVAERVVRACRRSVMIARGKASVGGYRRILVPTDFSKAAESALELALQLAAPQAEIELLHCWELPGAPARYFGTTSATDALLKSAAEDISAHVSSSFKKLIDTHGRDDVTIVPRSERHPPTKGIHERLDHGAFELAVMGSHGRRGLSRFLLGSVAESTVRHAHCSVLVMHKREQADD